MSVSFRAATTILANRLFDGCMEEFAIHEHIKPNESSPKWRCLTDGRNFIWVSIVDGNVYTFDRYRGNDPTRILDAVADIFQTEIFSEYQPQYWGFDTDEDWRVAEERMFKEMETKAMEEGVKFQENLRKFLRGQPHDLKTGTFEMVQAEIATALVLRDPELKLLQNEEWLKAEIRKVYIANRAEIDGVPF